MTFAKILELVTNEGKKEVYEVGIDGVNAISIFDNNGTIRIDFADNTHKILLFKDYRDIGHREESRVTLSPINFK